MLLSSILNSDIGNSTVVTNFIIGIAYLVVAFYMRQSKVLRLEYRDPFAILLTATGLQSLMHIFSVPVLVQTSLDTLVTMVAVAISVVLMRDPTIK